MKKPVYWSFLGLILLSALAVWKFSEKDSPATNAPIALDEVKWYTIDEAVAANKKNPKKMLVDVYTDWCGWCKVMDKQTFTDPEIIQYVNTNFYPVKFDAEIKETIQFNGKEYNWVSGGRRGYNQLAYELLKGRLGYPSLVYLDEDQSHIRVSPGFKKPEQLMPELKYAAENHYKSVDFNQYQAGTR